MRIITAREFRANQKKYFDLAGTEPIFVVRTKGRPAISISLAGKGSVPSAELLESISRGAEDIKNGRCFIIDNPADIWKDIQ